MPASCKSSWHCLFSFQNMFQCDLKLSKEFSCLQSLSSTEITNFLIKGWVLPFLSPIISYHLYLKFNHLLTYCVLIYVMWKRLHDYFFLYLYFSLHVHGSFTIPSSSNTISCHHCLTQNLPSFTFLPLLLHKYRYFCLWNFINVYFQNQCFCVAVSVLNWREKTC